MPCRCLSWSSSSAQSSRQWVTKASPWRSQKVWEFINKARSPGVTKTSWNEDILWSTETLWCTTEYIWLDVKCHSICVKKLDLLSSEEYSQTKGGCCDVLCFRYWKCMSHSALCYRFARSWPFDRYQLAKRLLLSSQRRHRVIPSIASVPSSFGCISFYNLMWHRGKYTIQKTNNPPREIIS